MNRQILVNKLLKEGFSQNTLMNFSDKQLITLSSRILGESEVMISKSDPMFKQKVAAAQKEKKTIETYESEELKGNQKKLDKNHNGKIDSQDFKILRGKKSEVKEENKPVDAHESKDLKGGQKKLDKNNNGKLDSQDFKMLRSKKSEVKEEKPSAGLSKEKKSEVVKKAKKGEDIGKKGKGFKEVEKLAKKGGAKDPKAVAAAALWKNIKREQVEISEWVEKLAEQKYHSFTSKKEIMEMISGKMNEIEVGPNVKKGHNNIPEFMTYDSIKNSEVEVIPAKPKVEPGQKPKRLSPFREKPIVKPKPKASLGEEKK